MTVIMPDAYIEKERKARKAHVCSECALLIQPSEAYKVCSGVWEGEPNRYKLCAHCAAHRTAVMDRLAVESSDMEESPGFGELYYWLQGEGWLDDYPPPVGSLEHFLRTFLWSAMHKMKIDHVPHKVVVGRYLNQNSDTAVPRELLELIADYVRKHMVIIKPNGNGFVMRSARYRPADTAVSCATCAFSNPFGGCEKWARVVDPNMVCDGFSTMPVVREQPLLPLGGGANE